MRPFARLSPIRPPLHLLLALGASMHVLGSVPVERPASRILSSWGRR